MTFNLLSHYTYAEIYGDFTETYNIVIAYTELDIDIIKQTRVFSSYNPFLSDQVT